MNNLNNLVNQENGEIAIDFISEQLSNLTKYSKRLSGSDAEILLAIAESLDHMSTKYSKTLGNLDKFTYGTYQTLRNEGKTHLEAINFMLILMEWFMQIEEKHNLQKFRNIVNQIK